MLIRNIINILPLVDRVMLNYHTLGKKISPSTGRLPHAGKHISRDEVEGDIFFGVW